MSISLYVHAYYVEFHYSIRHAQIFVNPLKKMNVILTELKICSNLIYPYLI